MSIAQSLLPELEHEAAITRTLLEVVPEADADWKPHPKSYSMGELAAHVANVLSWGRMTLEADSFDLAPPDAEPWVSPGFAGLAACLATFDANVAACRTALEATGDDAMMEEWRLLHGGEVVMGMPRVAVLRTFVLNHLVHHRGQLSVYLRLRDVPLPQIYGPNADNP